MITAALRTFAGRLSPRNRKRLHGLADRLLHPLGSVVGSARPTDLVALTFDDGPDPDVTPRLLDLLAANGFKATFFVLTDVAREHPQLIRRMVEEGHEIALHFDRHDRLTRMPPQELNERLAVAARELETLTGQKVRRFRPPYGAQNLHVLRAARRLSLEVVVWRPSAFEWEEPTAEAGAARFLDGLRGGEIGLLHDGYATPAGEPVPDMDRLRLAELVLQGMKHLGLRAASVAELIQSAGARRTFWVRT